MNGGLVRDQQRSRKEVSLRFDSAIVPAVSVLCQRRRTLVAKEAMSEFMADVAALPMRVMGIVMHNSRFMSAGDGNGRETRSVAEEGTIRIEVAQGDQPDLEMCADSHRINGINCVQSHLMPYLQSDAVCFRLEPTPESQSLAPQFFISADHDILHQLRILLAQLWIGAQQCRDLR